MAPRGTRPTPTAVKRAAGNPGHRRLNDAEPTPAPIEDWEPPRELDSVDARDEWSRLVPILRTARQITSADRAALIALCVEWARYLEAMREVRKAGLVIKASRSGYLMPNPYLSIGMRALQMCYRVWPELGLTPSSRSRVRMDAPADTGDPAEAAFAEFDRPRSRSVS